MTDSHPKQSLRQRLHNVIFGTESTAGRTFDILLLLVIAASVINLMLISVAAIEARLGPQLSTLEWVFTIVFSIEYATRVYAAENRWHYIRSFWGLIDLAAILPMYLAPVIPDAHYFVAVRSLRIVRMFRVFKLANYANDLYTLRRSLMQAQRKLQIFLGILTLFVTILGAIMYVVEGPEHGFTSIPRAIYWAVVTITTVGYGDISPTTPVGQTIAGIAILIGYGVLAVTTGVITAELTTEISTQRGSAQCPHCERFGHEKDADYCKFCGGDLDGDPDEEPPEDEDQAKAREKLD